MSDKIDVALTLEQLELIAGAMEILAGPEEE